MSSSSSAAAAGTDPGGSVVLTSLCTICHAEPPKYTCPRCAAHTCSLACSRRHKAWASCSGVRDPAAYVAPSALRTPAGIDRDYNFLSGIERARERGLRELVEERGLLRPAEVNKAGGGGDEKLVRKLWFGEGSGGRMPRQQQQKGGKRPWERNEDGEGGKESFLDRKVRRRLGHLDVRVVEMPRGLSRQRENTTCWNRRTNKINWAVEWLIFDDAEGKQPTRIRHRALETVPLFRAAADSIAWHRKGQERAAEEEDEDEDMLPARKRRRVLIREVKEERRSATLGAMQDWEAEQGTWPATHYPVQNPFTGAWDLERGSVATTWTRDEEADEKRRSQFFLLKPLTPAGKPKELIPVESTETLAQALPGRTVLEFPTVYILPPSAGLPEGYVLGSTERRERPKRSEANGENRGGPRERQQAAGKKRPYEQQQRGRGKMQKKVAFADKPAEVEQGQVNSDGEVLEEEDITSSEPETTSSDDSSSDSEGEANEEPFEVKIPKKNGLVDYASDSGSGSEGEEGEEEDGQADLDLSTLNPENPELVRGAIAEIVNLFT